MLVADQAREDDQIVEYRGSTVLCLETTEDDPELVLVPLDVEDDESDPDADEESKL